MTLGEPVVLCPGRVADLVAEGSGPWQLTELTLVELFGRDHDHHPSR